MIFRSRIFLSLLLSVSPLAEAEDNLFQPKATKAPKTTKAPKMPKQTKAPKVDLEARIAELEAELEYISEYYISPEEADTKVYDAIVSELGFFDFDSQVLDVDKDISRISSAGRTAIYDSAGYPIILEYSPEAAFYLENADADSRVKDMVGDGFSYPTSPNEPSDVAFDLPTSVAYSDPSDLIYMPILEMASLIKDQIVSCETVVTTFIDRLAEFDPYLGIVATPLYEKAIETAKSHDALLASGTYVGPLMCIPFGLKDHHQVYDDDVTMYGSLLYAENVQSIKSEVMKALLDAGAIPIAKMMLGTFAWSSANGWGECMSPYLNGPGCGSSCGSGSGAALGALPFAISEETSGSIACPASASLISGHIGSYGSLSRTGAGLLCSETDHIGFHSRYLSDFGVIFNYARTGDDPLDGDSVAQEFIDPATVDPSAMKVMIIEGDGEWEYDAATDSYSWNNVVRQSYGKTAWHWEERVAAIKEKLTAAGVAYDSFSLEDANKLWSFNSTSPYFDCAQGNIDVMMAAGPWAKTQEFDYAFENSKWKTFVPRNVPAKSYRYAAFCMKEIGKKFLNDPFWDTYDVVIDTMSNNGPGYDIPNYSFEQWIRTSKTFVMDYYEALPCATAGGNTIEGSYAILTAKPFEDYKNFAIGSIIQDTSAILFPNEMAIKEEFEGRSRCPFSFYEKYNDMTSTCPPLNGPGAPPGPSLRNIDGACTPGDSRNHLPEAWAQEPYVAPYDMVDEKVPDRALWRWDEYGPVACTAICPWVQSFCDMKGIVCDERRLEEEAKLPMPEPIHRRLTDADHRRLAAEIAEELFDSGEM